MLQMNKHASRGCIDESSTTGNMGEDFTIDVLIVRATITEMIQVFMMWPFPSLEISFQIYKKYNNKNKIKIKIYFQHFNHHANVIKLYFSLLFFDFRCFSYVLSSQNLHLSYFRDPREGLIYAPWLVS